MTKLFVGSLPYSTTDQELKDMFSAHGAVTSATIINDRFSGRSKGFGFVEMENDDEAQKAIEALNNSQLGERSIVVSVARPREDRPQGGGFGGGGGSRGGYNDRKSGGFDRGRRDH